jgi:two-component system, cell cycle sensor histidine kinase and response regulator CckA
MDLRYIVVSSVVLQLSAAILALRLVRFTARRSAWLLIAGATSLMAFRRCFILVQLTMDYPHAPVDFTSEVVALATSALMAVGVARIAPIFVTIKRSRDELLESKRILNAILDASPIGICLVREHSLQWTNEALQRMLGRPASFLHDCSPKTLFPDVQEYDRVGEQFYCQLRDKGIVELDARLLRQDGTIFPCSVMARPLDLSDTSCGYIVAMTDLTERHKLEAQIIHAQKMEAVGRLAGGIAHDFNNLLTSVMGYAEMLHKNLCEGTRLRRYASEITKAAELASSLTRQLLTFSHRQVRQTRVLHVDTVVTDIHKMLKRLIGEDIELVIRYNAGDGHICMDQGQIEQVLLNLVINARDAMIQGGRLTIETAIADLDQTYARTQLMTSAGRYVVLTVRDTGSGMDENVLEHIFEPFFTTKEKGKGTGLGLATTYAIVQQAGGAIQVMSELGRGTTFKIYLPITESQPDKTPKMPVCDLPQRGHETILLVEDEASVRDLAKEALEENGYLVLEAEHGLAALELCRNYRGVIHLLVTDVVMPQMNGYQLAERLTDLRPEMKVLYMSGYADKAMALEGIQESGTAFLQKPFATAELLQQTRKLLDSSLAYDKPDGYAKDHRTLQ